MTRRQNISISRRSLLKNGLKISAFSILLAPFKNALASGAVAINKSMEKLQKILPIDKLVHQLIAVFGRIPGFRKISVIRKDGADGDRARDYETTYQKQETSQKKAV